MICKSKNKMQKAYDIIMANAIDVSCTAIQARVINEIKPMPALTKCLHNSIDGLNITPEHILIDGDKYTSAHNIPYTLVPKGDNTYLCIAAAAIVAKYRRDEYMIKLHEIHPEYNFKGSKGYYCGKHKIGLMEHGMTNYHRHKYVNTWVKNKGIKLPNGL